MPRGIVKLFDSKRGYGFIRHEGAADPASDVFVHISTVERAGLSTLMVGQPVEYDIGRGRGRPVAENFKW
jgi:CspA family cold shock protein